MSEEQENKSDFGKGLAYCLGLFLAHAGMWFNAASDHLFEFDADAAPEGIKSRCIKFRERVLILRNNLSFNAAIEDDYEWATQEAKELLRLIDEAHGIKTIKGLYE